MRILLAGASGFLGTRLAQRLRDSGHDLVRLVRRDPSGPEELRWDPSRGVLDPAALGTVDAVVNLAGAGVGDHRWTEEYKRTLVESRLGPTTTLADAIAALPAGQRPQVMVNASGVGYYGDTGERAVDEQSPPGTGFMVELCQRWEGATEPARAAGVRTAFLRTGYPLHASGGFLKPLLLPVKLGVGGPLGSGKQYQPWISMPDWLSAVEFVLARDDVDGPVNMVGPDPVPNKDLVKALARRLHRPSLFPVPKLALNAVVGGEFAEEALASLRVLPGVLTERGFRFAHTDLDSALAVAFD